MALLGLSSVAVSLAKDSAIRSYWSMAGGPGQKLAWDRNKTLRERNGWQRKDGQGEWGFWDYRWGYRKIFGWEIEIYGYWMMFWQY